METGLRLLMRDGAVNVIFRPPLLADQYAEFMTVLDQAPTKEDLEIAGQKFADERGLEFTKPGRIATVTAKLASSSNVRPKMALA